MKCKYCDGTGKTTEWVATDTVSEYEFSCRKCNGTGEITLTNEEYIRSCSTSELAVLLYKIGFYSNITDDVMNTALMENIPTEEAFELWLKEKHE